MAGITGIGSGMDINRMVGALVNAQTAPKAAQLQRLSSSTDAKFSALGQLQSALGTFQNAMKDLNKTSLFDNMKASSSKADTLSVTANADAIAGKYSVEVQSLATSSRVATVSTSSGFTTDGAGSLTVKLGEADEDAVTVDIADGSSLLDIRDALNEQLKDKGINVNIVNNPADGSSQLVLSSEKTGTGNDIKLEGEGSMAVFAQDVTSLQTAKNAEFTIDGLKLESASNTVKDAIPDVEFTLKAETEANKPVTVTVGEDQAGVKDQLKKFVSAYNEFMSTAKSLTAVTSVGEGEAPVAGKLVGDSTVRNLMNGIRAELGNAQSGDGIRVLADLGITTDKDGKLVIDDKKLDASLEQNFDKVGQFFAGDNGLMSRLDGRISPYAGKDGIIGTRQSSLEATRADIKEQTEKLNMRTAQIEARLFKQFNAMDALVGQLSTTSSSLMQSLASLPGISSQ